MSRTIILCILLIMLRFQGYGQCIESEKIQYGGSYGYTDYIFHVPTYTFSYNGSDSTTWNVLNDPIHISQAPAQVLKFKYQIEKAIQAFAGPQFFSDLRFESFEVAYPERLQAFRDSGRFDVTRKHHKASYFYYYQFKPDSASAYLIGVPVNEAGKIIAPFPFPSKKNYHPINKSFTYCKLITIAQKHQPHINPIGSIQFNYNRKSKRFYWLISQEVTHTHEGLNYLNQVEIDAADLSKVKVVRSHMFVVY